MKTLSFALLLMASMAFVMLGCSDNSDSVVTPNGQTNSSLTLAKMGDVLHSATGNAHWRVIGTQSRVRCLFTAIQHKDGTFSGEVINNDEGATFKFHGKVYDLRVKDGTAQIFWKFTSGSMPAAGPAYMDLTGMIATMVVVDNGEGKSASEPDRVSLIWFDPPGTSYDYTTPPMTIEQLFALGTDEYISTVLALGYTYDDFLSPIDQGSVQVR